MGDEKPIHRRRVVYCIPGMNQVHVERDIAYKSVGHDKLRMDIYRPLNVSKTTLLPGVVYIHGGPIASDFIPKLKDWGQYQSYGELITASGLVAITFNHRYYNLSQMAQAAGDVKDAVSFIQDHGRTWGLDADRLCFWAISGGGPFLSFAFRERPAYVRCLVTYYALLDPGQIDDAREKLKREDLQSFSPLEAIKEVPPTGLPIFVARAGKDYSEFKRSNDLFIQQALEGGAAIVVENHPNGQHAFDILDDDDRSRSIIASTLDFVKSNLLETVT